MRLKSIKLAGFKSFVDPTTVHFPSNLCAIVGPNGCGKSNVIDAVRWVMGETSAKNLRGESMADVIFNGSGGRKPVGQASIELVFDNAEGRVTGEYAAYAEISVRRKVTRDGQSNYYLNGNKCRRRDITDLFLGTGLGPRSYAIIEQGMISRLIEAKPDELRIFVEEAAGISKYKERRRDTENRIQRTQDNLERLADIREELGRQLGRLERQAKSAEKYIEYKQEERRVAAELLALRWRAFDRSSARQKQDIQRLEVEQEGLIAGRRACETAIEKIRADHTDSSDRFQEVQGNFYRIGADVARIEQSIAHAKQRALEISQDLEQTGHNLNESERHLAQDRQRAAGWDAELRELSGALQNARAAEQQSSAALHIAEQTTHDWQSVWDEFQGTSAGPRQQAEVQQARIQHLEQLLSRLGERQSSLAAEASSFKESTAEGELVELSELLRESELSVQECENQQSDNATRIAATREEEKQLLDSLNEARGRQQALKGRRASLEALQQAALGDDLEINWLESKGLAGNARLADSVVTESGWELAVETVLGSYLQAVAVQDLAASAELVQDFKKGELVFFSDGESPQTGANPGRPLASLVQGATAQSLLTNVYAADDVQGAVAMLPQLHNGESVVTRDGIWLGRNWLKVAREKDATSGVLLRKQELERIDAELRNLEQREAALDNDLQARRQRLQSLEAHAREIGAELSTRQRGFAELRSRLGAYEMQIEQFRARRQRAESELADVAAQQQSEQSSLVEARRVLQESIEKMAHDAQRREQLLGERDANRAQLERARAAAHQDRDQLHELVSRERSLSAQLNSIREGIGRLEVQVQRLLQRRDQLLSAVDVEDDPVEVQEQELESRLQMRLAAETELNEARAAVENLEHAMREQERQRGNLDEQLQELRGRLEQQRLAAQEINTRSRTIEEQIAEKQYRLAELLENLAEDADPAAWEENLNLIGNRISRLGLINLAAVDEFKLESERKQYLDAQNNELREALETLHGAIQKIDRETRTRFKETFDQINTHLQELFPKLFGGGHAFLQMTGDDLLDTGVAVMARPPGKKITSIHLLSGGEKAMTAIALVFSIFQLNPAPFCMLDEVDAPLDDANVERYAMIIREMSDRVQFIVITHNKVTMEATHQLMGVTMHEPGVSRLVSVDVDEAVELAEA